MHRLFWRPLTTSAHRRHHDGEEQDPAGRPVSCHTSCGSVLFLHADSYQTGFFVFCLHSGQAVALIIFILGLGTLLPWNFFITASQVSHLHAINHFLKTSFLSECTLQVHLTIFPLLQSVILSVTKSLWPLDDGAYLQLAELSQAVK